MRNLVILAALAGTTLAAPALAQTTNPTFTGPRVEATIGYDHVGAGSDVDNNNGRDDQSIDGLLYGGGIGYDVAVGGVVVGAEAELLGSTAKSDRFDYTDQFGFGRVKQGRDIYVGARVGVLAGPSTLVYAKGGYTNTKLRVLAGNSNVETDNDFNLDGWRIGAGAERALSGNSYAKLEYRYSNYERGNVDYALGGTSNRFDVDTDRHQVVASYGFRF